MRHLQNTDSIFILMIYDLIACLLSRLLHKMYVQKIKQSAIKDHLDVKWKAITFATSKILL